MPYPNEHSCRLHDPKKYDEFRRTNDKFGSGIDAIFGIIIKPKRVSELQAIRFDKNKHTVAQAKAWCKDHNHKCIKFEAAGKKVLAISGVIGWEVEAQDVRDFLNDAQGEDIEVQISSPGGYVYPGLEIFNLLRNHDGKVTTHLMGLAASMASYIAMVGDYVIAEDNAVFMIHNASGYAMGDQNIMRKAADIMEGLSNLIAQQYMQKTGKSQEELKALMDDTTFLYGDEIKKAGFVDEIIKTEKVKDKIAAVALAAVSVDDCLAKMKTSEQNKEDFERAAALLGDIQGGDNRQQGSWKYCICDKCNFWEDHIAGKVCGKCPECKTQMHGSDKKPKGRKSMKSLKDILAIEDSDERKVALDKFFGEQFEADQTAMVKEVLMDMKKADSTEALEKTIADLQEEMKALKELKSKKPDDKLEATVTTLQGEVEALRGKLEATQKRADDEADARRVLEIKDTLKDKEIVGDTDKMSKTIFMLEKVNKEQAKDMLDQFEVMSSKLKAAGVFSELGNTGDGSGDGAYAKLKKMVETHLTENSNATPAKAWKNVVRDNPELYKEYLKER